VALVHALRRAVNGHAWHVQAAAGLSGAKESCLGGGGAGWILKDYLQAALMKRLEITKLLLQGEINCSLMILSFSLAW